MLNAHIWIDQRSNVNSKQDQKPWAIFQLLGLQDLSFGYTHVYIYRYLSGVSFTGNQNTRIKLNVTHQPYQAVNLKTFINFSEFDFHCIFSIYFSNTMSGIFTFLSPKWSFDKVLRSKTLAYIFSIHYVL